MAIKKYKATKDTTIVNAFQPGLVTRGTGANMGEADVLEVFSIYGRALPTASSQELSRILTKFPVTSIVTDRTAGLLPASGSVSFYLRLYNAEHSKTVPVDYTLVVQPISQSWQEGVGLDLETYKDLTKGDTGANWMSASNTAAWTSVGGDYLTGASTTYTQTFSTGLEDVEVDITQLVEDWIIGESGGKFENYGVGVRLSSSYEAYFSSSTGQDSGSIIDNLEGATKSYYTKRFFASGSQFFFKRPAIEARWNSTVKDDRGDFYYSSSLAPAADNLNIIYLYNYVRGRLTNIPGFEGGKILVSLYSGSSDNSAPSGSKLVLYDGNTNITGGHKSTGIYTASMAITAAATPLSTLYDVWHSGSTEYFTGSITPIVLTAAQTVATPVYYMNITNLKRKYRNDEKARFNLYVRNKNWSPTIYTVANATPESTTIVSASYRVFRAVDGFEAIPYGTGSTLSTQMSYDVSGNYFDFNVNLLEPGYMYALKFAFYDAALSSWVEQPDIFKFRVESYEY
jgi:hypothetical protein